MLAADQFLITPAGRVEDAARAHAGGDEIRTVIAGYHWFTDWGRDTMISLEALTLCTGRKLRSVLHSYARLCKPIRDGLIPNMFPEGSRGGLYHTADATLWFFHALDRYICSTGDRDTLAAMMPHLLDVMNHHIEGTRFGIHTDSADGLLSQGEEGFQLTWMDAKVDGWVVTPGAARRWRSTRSGITLYVLWKAGARNTISAAAAILELLAAKAQASSTGASGLKRAGTYMTWWMAKRKKKTRCSGLIRFSPFR